MKKAHRRASWAISRAMSDDMPNMVFACVVLTYASTMAATPNRKGNPGVQLLAVCVSVTGLEKFGIGFLSDAVGVLSRMQDDPMLLHDVLREAVGLNYTSQITGGGDYIEGPHVDSIELATMAVYKVVLLRIYIVINQ